jgi:hypothetical protein
MATWRVVIRYRETGYLVHQLGAVFDSRRAARYAAILKQAELTRRRLPLKARAEPAGSPYRGKTRAG